MRLHPPAALTDSTLAAAVEDLAARDPGLGGIVARYGPPPMWAREPGFATLVHLVLEQQVSLASAQAAFDRLRAVADPLTPAAFLRLGDAELLAIGFSRQKTRYGRALHGRDRRYAGPGRLPALDDDAVDAALIAVPGIGPWTATIYRLMVLLRPDAWPVHDIALAQAIAEVRGLDRRPAADEMLGAGRGLAAVAGGRGADPVAPLPVGAGGAGRPPVSAPCRTALAARARPHGAAAPTDTAPAGARRADRFGAPGQRGHARARRSGGWIPGSGRRRRRRAPATLVPDSGPEPGRRLHQPGWCATG